MVIDFTTLNVSLRPVLGCFFFLILDAYVGSNIRSLRERSGCCCHLWLRKGAQSRMIWQTSLSVYSPAEKLLVLSLLLIDTEIFTQCFPITSVEERQLQRTFVRSLPVLPSSPMKKRHYLPLICNPLETIIFTSVAFQTMYHISAQRPILIFHCFPVACKGHKCSTD